MSTFTKQFTAPNGTVLWFHKIVRLEAQGMDRYTAVVASWPSEADYLAGKGPAWNTYETADLAPSIAEAILDQVVTSGTFAGAARLADGSETLQAAKLRKRAQVKIDREGAKSKPLVTPYGVFDADKEARDNIADTYALLKLVVERGGPDSTDFTLHDNSVVQLTLAQLGDVALLLGQQVQTAYGIGRGLQAQIETAETKEQLEELQWPAS